MVEPTALTYRHDREQLRAHAARWSTAPSARAPSARRLKAFVSVMEGCEKRCTFCVVPQTRGASEALSRPKEGRAARGHRKLSA